MQTVKADPSVKFSGNFDSESYRLRFNPSHTEGGGATANGLLASDGEYGTPVDNLGDYPTIDIREGFENGDEPIIPTPLPPEKPIDPIMSEVMDNQEKEDKKNWALLFIALIGAAIIIYFLINKTAK